MASIAASASRESRRCRARRDAASSAATPPPPPPASAAARAAAAASRRLRHLRRTPPRPRRRSLCVEAEGRQKITVCHKGKTKKVTKAQLKKLKGEKRGACKAEEEGKEEVTIESWRAPGEPALYWLRGLHVSTPRSRPTRRRTPSPPATLLERLAEETRAKTTAPQMMVGPLEGRFLALLVRGCARARARGRHVHRLLVDLHGARRSRRAAGSSRSTSNEETTEIARRYASEAGVVDRIDYRVGPAGETCPSSTGRSTSSSSTPTRRATSTTTRPRCRSSRDGGLIVADNVLWSGRVVDRRRPTTRPARSGASTTTCAMTTASRRVMLTVRDGMTLIRRR